MAMTHDCMNIQTATDMTKFGEINYGVLAVYCPYIAWYHNVYQPSQLYAQLWKKNCSPIAMLSPLLSAESNPHSGPQSRVQVCTVPLYLCVSDENQNANTGYEILFQLTSDGHCHFMKACYMVWWYGNRAVGMKLMQSLHGNYASEIL